MIRIETGSLALGDILLPYTVQRSARRRRSFALFLQPEGGVRVLAPVRVGLDVILDMIRKRAGWITGRMKNAKQPAVSLDFIVGDTAVFCGAFYPLTITQEEGRSHAVVFEDNAFKINIPHADLSPQALHEEVRVELLLWYKKQARHVFAARLAFWAEKLGVTYGRVSVTRATRRWGSCNVRNDIRLNWRLITVPPDLLDYVAAHELCHVRHKNHARAFWQFLASVMPDWKERRRRLRGYEKTP